MYKPHATDPRTCVGIDVSKDPLEVCCFDADDQQRTRPFKNTPTGHRRLIIWLGAPARVVVESTGRYGLDLTLALHEAEHIDVMVANPKALRGYAKAQMRRTKTDEVDAAVIADYARRMPFRPWEPPEEAVTELQAIARRIQALTTEQAREKNRRQSVTDSLCASAVVVNDIEVNLRHLARRIAELVRQAPHMGAFYRHLLAKGKPPMVAVVAVMRKLLHSSYGMLKHDQDFDGAKFYIIPEKAPVAA